MEKNEYAAMIGMIQQEYSSQYGQSAVAAAWGQVKDCERNDMFKALDSVFLSNTHLPSLQKVIAATIDEKNKRISASIAVREERSVSEKREYERGTTKSITDDRAVVRDTMIAIRSLLAGNITRGEYLDSIRHLDSLYPRAGFSSSGGRLASFYSSRGLSLTGKPQSFIFCEE